MGMTVRELDQFYDFAQRQLIDASNSYSMRDLVNAWEDVAGRTDLDHFEAYETATLEEELDQSEIDIQQGRCFPADEAISQVMERLRNRS